VNDLLILYLGAKSPERMPYYAAMTTAGSLAGCFALYAVARSGGAMFLRSRVKTSHLDRAMQLYQRHGLLAVIVPALLPPPMPFKLFVVLAGTVKVTPWRFGVAIAIGRGVRYFGQGALAAFYGEEAVRLVERHGAHVALGLVAAVLAAALIAFLVKRGR